MFWFNRDYDRGKRKQRSGKRSKGGRCVSKRENWENEVKNGRRERERTEHKEQQEQQE